MGVPRDDENILCILVSSREGGMVGVAQRVDAKIS